MFTTLQQNALKVVYHSVIEQRIIKKGNFELSEREMNSHCTEMQTIE